MIYTLTFSLSPETSSALEIWDAVKYMLYRNIWSILLFLFIHFQNLAGHDQARAGTGKTAQ